MKTLKLMSVALIIISFIALMLMAIEWTGLIDWFWSG